MLVIGCGSSSHPVDGVDDAAPIATDGAADGVSSDTPITITRSIEMYSGDGEMVMGGWPGGDPLKVIVLDNGAPVAGVTVHWQTTAGNMAMTGEFQTGLVGTSVTDAGGIARVGLRGEFLSQMTSAVPATIRASIAEGSVDFTVWSTYWTQQVPALPSTYVTVPSSIDLGMHAPGEVIPSGIKVLVAFNAGTEGGRGMPGVGVRFTIGNDATVDTPPILSCLNAVKGKRTGGTVFTDATGTASCDVKLPTTPGHYSFGVLVGGGALHHPLLVDIH